MGNNLYDLLKALKSVIDRKVVNIQTLRTNVSAGDTTIPVKSAKRFEPCSSIVFYRTNDDDGEIRTIDSIVDYHTITITEPLLENYSTTNTRIQNLNNDGNMRVKNIFIGDPPVIPFYPSITIAGNSRSSEWLTLESTSERYEVSISVYTKAEFHDVGYKYVLNMTKEIERALYFSFYPLSDPYFTTILTEDVADTDTIIRVEDDDLNRQFLWFFLENDQYTRHVSPLEYKGNGVIELRAPVGAAFSAGDSVIYPGRHFYDCRPQSTDYGYVVKNDLLFGSRISYFATQEQLISTKFYTPIDRD